MVVAIMQELTDPCRGKIQELLFVLKRFKSGRMEVE
jgi:hypothetical protein